MRMVGPTAVMISPTFLPASLNFFRLSLRFKSGLESRVAATAAGAGKEVYNREVAAETHRAAEARLQALAQESHELHTRDKDKTHQYS